jgi:L-threonylcarbamoyladenylate synthase
MTRRWHIEGAPTPLQLTAIAKTLNAGGVVLLPTDTIYGLHALALNPEAVDRIAAMKGREETKPFIVLVSSVDELASLGVDAPPRLVEALGTIWPAPLTVILKLHAPIAASRGSTTLAVRIPALDWLRELAARSGPLVSTSANRSGEPAVQTPAGFTQDPRSPLDGIVDGGVRDGAPSAILDLSGDEPRFVREGEKSFTQKVWKTLWKSL